MSVYMYTIKYQYNVPNRSPKLAKECVESDYMKAFAKYGLEIPLVKIELLIENKSRYAPHDHVIIRWEGPVFEGFFHKCPIHIPKDCVLELIYNCHLIGQEESDQIYMIDEENFKIDQVETWSRYDSISVPGISNAIVVKGNIMPLELLKDADMIEGNKVSKFLANVEVCNNVFVQFPTSMMVRPGANRKLLNKLLTEEQGEMYENFQMH